MASPIHGAGAVSSLTTPLASVPDPRGAGGGASFAHTLQRALGEVTELQDSAQGAISKFLSGEDVELHEVMAATEEAGIAVEMLIEVRNRLVEAYRTLTNMQG